jgi:putative transcriptional regulator
MGDDGKRRATVAAELKALRARLGVTQQKLAYLVGNTTSTVNRWEGGRHRPSPLAQSVLDRLAAQAATVVPGLDA